MSKVVLELANVSKKYKIGFVKIKTFREFAANYFSRLRTKTKNNYLWALKNINFKLYEGDILGIIGHNGAGKSTFLKLLSQVTTPTTGNIKIWGQIASLLEVGTGFHHELTGRENIYLNGAILGMKRKEINLVLDQIIDFSGIEEALIDTPIKKYSSGMKVRLAFAVAIHLKANILLMDEVLAVSDLEFQERSLKKLKSLTQEGKTIIFVSHDLSSIKSLCDRCIIMEKGEIIKEGETDDIIKFYQQRNNKVGDKNIFNNSFDLGFIKLTNIQYFGSKQNKSIQVGERLNLQFDYQVDPKTIHINKKRKKKMFLKVEFKNENDLLLFSSDEREVSLENSLDGQLKLNTTSLNILEGTYYLSLLITFGQEKYKIEKFKKIIVEPDYSELNSRDGLINVNSTWDLSYQLMENAK